MSRAPFPLQWPEGWKRTPPGGRMRSMFEPRFTEDRDTVLRWLDKRGSRVVITSNLPTRQDGLPYHAATSDPGIAIWWVERGHERVVACDRWLRADENMRAIAKTLEAVRGLDRWGATEIVERAFAGFAALPPGSGAEVVPPIARRTWRDVFAVNGLEHEVSGAELLTILKTRYRDLIKRAHPDAGGSHDRAAELNAAIAEAERELATKEH